MNLDLNPLSLPLAKGRLLRIEPGRGQRVECLSGCLWITQDHDTRDIVLNPGEGFTLDRPVAALLSALTDSRLMVLEHTPG